MPMATRPLATSPTSPNGPNSKPSISGDNYADRTWFVNPMSDGKIYVTDFYTSRFTGALCITVSGPIRDDDEDIVGVLGLDMKFEDLAKMEDDEDQEED